MFGKKKQLNDDVIIGEIINRAVEKIQDKVVGNAIDGATETVNAILKAEDSILNLKKERGVLQDQIDKLKSRAKIEEAEVKTLVKMAETRAELSLEKKELEMLKGFAIKEVALSKKLHEELMQAHKDNQKRLDEFMTKVMDKLTHIKHIEGKCETEVTVVK